MSRFAEHDFQNIAYVFLRKALPKAQHWGTDHAGKRSVVQGARLKRRGIVAGIPDLLTLADGVLIGWELKVGKNQATESQGEFGARIISNRGHYFVVRTIEEIERYLRALGFQLQATAGGTGQHAAERVDTAPKPNRKYKARPDKPSAARIRAVQAVLARVGR